VPLPPLRFPIKSGSSIKKVFFILIHEIIAVKHRPCLPDADLQKAGLAQNIEQVVVWTFAPEVNS